MDQARPYLTPSQRALLIANSDLVMFDANRGFKAHRLALALALIPLLVVSAFDVFVMIRFDEQISDHPGLCMCPICAIFIIAAGSVPLLYILFDDLLFKRAGKNGFRRRLAQQMPPGDVECRRVLVAWVYPPKAEGEFVFDGVKEGFGFFGFANLFLPEKGAEMLVLTAADGFVAYVRRDERIEELFGE